MEVDDILQQRKERATKEQDRKLLSKEIVAGVDKSTKDSAEIVANRVEKGLERLAEKELSVKGDFRVVQSPEFTDQLRQIATSLSGAVRAVSEYIEKVQSLSAESLLDTKEIAKAIKQIKLPEFSDERIVKAIKEKPVPEIPTEVRVSNLRDLKILLEDITKQLAPTAPIPKELTIKNLNKVEDYLIKVIKAVEKLSSKEPTEKDDKSIVKLLRQIENAVREIEIPIPSFYIPQSAAGNVAVDIVSGGGGNGAIIDGVDSTIKATVKKFNNANPVMVGVSDASGNLITNFGGTGGTQYNNGDAVPTTPVGTAQVYNNGGVWQVVSQLFPLPVSSTTGAVDANNSTTSTLLANGVFTGTSTSVLNYTNIEVIIYSDQSSAAGGLLIEFSKDGTNWDDSSVFTFSTGSVGPNQGQVFIAGVRGQFYRIVYTNGSVNQTTFRLQSVLKTHVIGGDVLSISGTINGNNHAAITMSQIIGLSTAGGGTYVPVKVTPSGAVASAITASNVGDIADGADVTMGSTADAAVSSDTTGTLSGKLRGLVKILADVWDSTNHWLKISIQNATLAVTQSGTWTVQPGNTANTTPWLVQQNQTTFSPLEAAYTAAQTDTAIVTATNVQNITVRKITVSVDTATTVSVSFRIGLGPTNTPTTSKVLMTHPGLAPGSWITETFSDNYSLIQGATDDDLRITSTVPSNGSLRVKVETLTA